MQCKGSRYTFIFACIVCFICSFFLAAVSQGLKSRRELNELLDVKKNILKAVRMKNPLPSRASPQTILNIYKEKIKEWVVDKEGNIVPDQKADKLNLQDETKYLPVYVYEEQGKVVSYCFPIIGKGLWSTLYGYLALQSDGKTVRGITFYKDKETPGLGGEIGKDWFQDNFSGKSIWSESKREFVSIVVVKGKVKDKMTGEQARHAVDGISGATLTCQGVTAMLKKWIKAYTPFLKKVIEEKTF